MSASHRRAADASSVLSTCVRSKVERLMTLSTSALAACRCNNSFSSRVSRATFVSRLAVEVLRGCPAFGAMRLLRAAAFGACALGDLPPALDRRRIAAPRLRTRHRGEIRLAHRVMVRHNALGVTFALSLKKRSFSKTAQMCAAHGQVRRLVRMFGPADVGVERAIVEGRHVSPLAMPLGCPAPLQPSPPARPRAGSPARVAHP